MFITLVWADDEFATELYNERQRAFKHVVGMQLTLGLHADCVFTRPNRDGIAGLVGIRPIYDTLSSRFVGVWLEYGENVAKIDPRDCKILTLI